VLIDTFIAIIQTLVFGQTAQFVQTFLVPYPIAIAIGISCSAVMIIERILDRMGVVDTIDVPVPIVNVLELVLQIHISVTNVHHALDGGEWAIIY
jgi:hypothetical protein